MIGTYQRCAPARGERERAELVEAMKGFARLRVRYARLVDNPTLGYARASDESAFDNPFEGNEYDIVRSEAIVRDASHWFRLDHCFPLQGGYMSICSDITSPRGSAPRASPERRRPPHRNRR